MALARADNITGWSRHKCIQRQYSRVHGILKNKFGGKKLLQECLRTETLVRRMFPPLRPWPGPRPPAARQCNKRSREAKAKQKRKYYDNFARDLMVPTYARERATRRFFLGAARDGQRKEGGQFLLPVQPGATKAFHKLPRKWPGTIQ